MNKVTLTARIGSEPELRALSGGSDRMIATALITYTTIDRNAEVENTLKATVWRDSESFARLSIGDRILISGSIDIDSVDRGSYKEQRVSINVNSFKALGGDRPSNPNPLATKKAVGVDFEKHLARNVAPIAAFDSQPVAQTYSPDYDDIPF